VRLAILLEKPTHFLDWHSLFLRYEFDSQTDRFSLASTYCDRALSIATELDIPLKKECMELKQQLESSYE
jgi:hypothetical protein